MIKNRAISTATIIDAKYTPLLIACVGLAVRSICILTCEYGVHSDAHEFRELAVNLIAGKGLAIDNLLTAYRMPGYPMFLALLFAVLKTECAVKLTQALVELCTGYLVFLIAKKELGYRSGLGAFTIWALLPVSIIQPVSFMSEGFFTCIFMLLIYCMTFGFSYRTTVFSGILCGILTLIKPHMILFPLVFLIIVLLNKTEIRRSTAHTALYTVLIVAVLTPWVLRNKTAVGSYTLNTNGGQNLYIGNSPGAGGSFYDIPRDKWPPTKDEVIVDRYFKKGAMAFITGNPVGVMKLIPRKIAHLFSLESMHAILLYYKGSVPKGMSYAEAYRTTPAWLLFIVNIPYIALVIVSVWVFFYCSPTVSFFRSSLVIIGFWIAVHCIYFGTARFHYPLLPLFAIAAPGLGQIRSTEKNRYATAGATGVSALFCMLWATEIFTAFSR